MIVQDIWTAVRQWVPFVVRTVGYGMVSCFVGPFQKDHAASLWAMRRWCVTSAASLDIRIEVSGVENVPASGAFVYCSNHQSLVDILVLGSVLPGDYKWAAKRALMKIPFLGWHLRLAGHVPVDRGGGSQAAEAAIDRFVAVLEDGKPLLIFPEGTRTLDGRMKAFKPGAFRAALRGKSPIVPVALDGTFDMMSKGDVSTGEREKIVRVRIGAPISLPSEGEEMTRVASLLEQTHGAIGRMFEGLRATARRDA